MRGRMGRMINATDNPVAWALLVDELGDAREHLESLVAEMIKTGDACEIDFQIRLGHIYSHLNRAWHARNDPRSEVSFADFETRSRFPTDITPT